MSASSEVTCPSAADIGCIVVCAGGCEHQDQKNAYAHLR
jgi:hypothetical protein